MNDTTKSASALDLRALMLALGERPLVIYPAYRRLVGGHWGAAAALAQIVYWWSAVGGRRFYKTDADLAAEVGLSADEMRTVKAKLREVPGLAITREGLPAKTWYELDAEAFASALADAHEPTSTELKHGQDVQETVPQNLQTRLGPRPQTSLGPAQQTNTEMTTEHSSKTTVLSGVSNGEEPGETESREDRALQSLMRQRERQERLNGIEAARAAERRLYGILEAAGGAELVRLLRDLTRPGIEAHPWRLWIQHQILPEVDRLGEDLAGRVLAEAVRAATGARDPRPYIVRILRSTEAPRGARTRNDTPVDLDDLLGPLEEG